MVMQAVIRNVGESWRGSRSTSAAPPPLASLNLAALDVPTAGRKFVLELTAEQQQTLANGIERAMAH